MTNGVRFPGQAFLASTTRFRFVTKSIAWESERQLALRDKKLGTAEQENKGKARGKREVRTK